MDPLADAAPTPVGPAPPCRSCGPPTGGAPSSADAFRTAPDPSLVPLDAVVRRRDDAGYVVAGDRMLVRTATGAEHELNRSAGAIWLSCDGAVTVGGLIEELAAETGVPVAVMDHDVRVAVIGLRAVGLVELAPEQAGS